MLGNDVSWHVLLPSFSTSFVCASLDEFFFFFGEKGHLRNFVHECMSQVSLFGAFFHIALFLHFVIGNTIFQTPFRKEPLMYHFDIRRREGEDLPMEKTRTANYWVSLRNHKKDRRRRRKKAETSGREL